MPSNSIMEHIQINPIREKDHMGYIPLALATPSDMEFLCPISYMYNYLPNYPRWLTPQPISLDRLFSGAHQRTAFLNLSENSIRLNPDAAKLPLHTGLESVQQGKNWKGCIEVTKELLHFFARDSFCNKSMLSDKRCLASVTEEQLQTPIIDTYTRFTTYFYPAADDERMQLLAQATALVFIFDGMFLIQNHRTWVLQAEC